MSIVQVIALLVYLILACIFLHQAYLAHGDKDTYMFKMCLAGVIFCILAACISVADYYTT